MYTFWKHGYDGATLPMLCKAMGINKPSLYAAFGSKQALFKRAADRYNQTFGQYFNTALQSPTAYAVAENLLRGAIDVACDKRNPGGCLNVQTGVLSGRAGDPIRREMIRRRSGAERLLRERLERAQSEGDLPPHCDPATLARYLVAVIRGIAMSAADGASQDEMIRIVGIALHGWPKSV